MHLRLDLYGASIEGDNRHAQVIMKSLGLTHQHSTPQSIADQWWFWNVESESGDVDLSKLPDYFSELKVDPMKCIGYGLSESLAIMIRDYKSSNLGAGPVIY